MRYPSRCLSLRCRPDATFPVVVLRFLCSCDARLLALFSDFIVVAMRDSTGPLPQNYLVAISFDEHLMAARHD